MLDRTVNTLHFITTVVPLSRRKRCYEERVMGRGRWRGLLLVLLWGTSSLICNIGVFVWWWWDGGGGGVVVGVVGAY